MLGTAGVSTREASATEGRFVQTCYPEVGRNIWNLVQIRRTNLNCARAVSAPLSRRSCPGRLNQNPPHQLSTDCEEVRAILPVHILGSYEAQVNFIHERCRLQRFSGVLASRPLRPSMANVQFLARSSARLHTRLPSKPPAERSTPGAIFSHSARSCMKLSPGIVRLLQITI